MSADETTPNSGEGAGGKQPDAGVHRDEVLRITKVVMQVLHEEKKPASWWRHGLLFVRDNGTLSTLILAGLAIVIASIFFGASPAYYFKHLALEDQKIDSERRAYEFKQQIAWRSVELGVHFLDQGLFEDAAEAFGEALLIDPHNVEATLGEKKARLFNKAAEGDFKPEVIEQRINNILSIEVDGKVQQDPHALAALGDLKAIAGRSNEAMIHYQEAIAIRPELSDAQAALADLAFVKGDLETAKAALSAAVDHAPFHPKHRINLASALLHDGQHEEAIEQYEVIFHLDRTLLLPYLEHATALRATKQFGKSVQLMVRYAHPLFFDNEFMKMPKNQGPWAFRFGDKDYTLDAFDEKYGYAYYAALLSAHLASDEAAIETLQKGVPAKVKRLPKRVTRPIFNALIAEAEQLRRLHDDAVAEQIDAFYAEFGIRIELSN